MGVSDEYARYVKESVYISLSFLSRENRSRYLILEVISEPRDISM